MTNDIVIQSHLQGQFLALVNHYIWLFLSLILREKSLAIYFENSQFRRNRIFNFIVSKIYVDKRPRV